MPKRSQSKSPASVPKNARKSQKRQPGEKAACHCMLFFENEVLVVRAKRKTAWQPVGGKIEGSETPLKCMLRETKEETGLDLTDANFRQCRDPIYQQNMKSDVFFYTAHAKPAVKPGSEIQECKWVSLDDVGVNCNFCLQQCLRMVQKKRKPMELTNENLAQLGIEPPTPTQEPTRRRSDMKVLPARNPRTVVVQERFNMDRLQIAIALDKDEYEIGKVKSYAREAKRHSLHVHYNDPGVGRLKATANGDPAVTQMGMCGHFRKAACLGLYHDLDCQDCAMQILIQTCEGEGLSCDGMKAFSKERKAVLQDLMDQGMARKQAKVIQNTCVFGGSLDKLKQKYQIPGAITRMFDDVQTITPALLSKFPVFRDAAVAKHGANYWNVDGCALSLLFQTCEKHIILACYDFWQKTRGYEPGALIHDGMHIKSDEEWLEAGIIKSEDIRLCEKHIEAETGFKMTLVVKPFEVKQRILDAYIARDTVDAGQFILQTLGHELVQDPEGGKLMPRLLYKHGRVWITCKKAIEQYVLSRINDTYDVFFRGQDTLFSHTRNMRQAEVILKYVMQHATPKPGFCKKLWDSSIGKICYEDGWYDFTEGQFHQWGEPNEPMTTMLIPHPFPSKPTDEVRTKLLELMAPVFNNKKSMRECIMDFFARSMAGMVVDKEYLVAVGERNSGKGFLLELMSTAFCEYVKGCNSEVFLYTGPCKDPAKQQSWMLDFEFVRLCYSNEITIDADGHTALDGNQIKRFNSGGDELVARKNYQDETYFRTQAHQMICCNDICDIKPSDAKETAIKFDMPSKFVNKGDPRLREIATNRHMITYFVKDDAVKDLAKTQVIVNAFTWEVLRSYKPHNVKIPDSMLEATEEFRSNDGENESDIFHQQFTFTQSESDTVTIANIKERVKELRLAITSTRYNKWLRAQGCTQANVSNKRSWRGLSLSDDESADTFSHDGYVEGFT